MTMIENVVKSFSPGGDRYLYIIDNSETRTDCDNIIEQYENTFYIKNDVNLGYGKAHNIGIKKAIENNSKYHIVLNPDLEFKPNIIDVLAEYANYDESIVYILPKVFYPNGKLQYLCKLLPTPFDFFLRRFLPKIGCIRKRGERFELRESGYNKIMNPPYLSGCFMFMRTEILKEIQFDERFFVYCEDLDLIRRLHRVGKTVFYPDVHIMHYYTQASYKSIKMLMLHIASACKYFNKYGWFFDKERRIQNKKILNEINSEKV